MKRILTLTLCAVMALSMAACGKKQTPQEIYDIAAQKNAELTSMDMTSDTTILMKQQGLEMTQTVKADMKMDQLNTDNIQFLMNATTALAGQSIDMVNFYTDGYYYMETSGQKIKAPFDLAKMTEQIRQSTGVTDFTSADMKELSVKKSGGNQILTYTVDPEKVVNMMDSVYKTMGIDESLGGQMKVHEMSGELTVNKDGFYSSMKSFMKLEVTVQEQTISMDMTMDATINNPGKPVEFTLPSTDGFEEVDPSILGLN